MPRSCHDPGSHAVCRSIVVLKLGSPALLQGVLIGSAVFPIAACLMWRKCTKYGAIAGAFIGQASGLTIWLIWAKVRE